MVTRPAAKVARLPQKVYTHASQIEEKNVRQAKRHLERADEKARSLRAKLDKVEAAKGELQAIVDAAKDRGAKAREEEKRIAQLAEVISDTEEEEEYLSLEEGA